MIDAVRLPPGPMVPRLFEVRDAAAETRDVTTLALAPLEGGTPGFAPGQFNMLHAFGVGEAAISISGDPAKREALLHTVRAVGPVSRALAGAAPGAVVGLRGPFGVGWPLADQNGRDLLFVAGGLGLAPLRPAILAALAAPERHASITLVVGARAPAEVLFPAQLADWTAGGALRLSVTVDHATPGWTGMVGVVTARLGQAMAGREPSNISAFVCGPEVMMRHTCQMLADAGVPPQRQWVSMERNMKCAIGTCGHCQFGADFICRDGPVLRWDRVASRLLVREL